jgi:hypothetical protein
MPAKQKTSPLNGRRSLPRQKLLELREKAKEVRQQVALDREQIQLEAQDVLKSAIADGKLTKLTLLLRADEQAVLQAVDAYASAHGLKSRNQVLRAALAGLLGIDLSQPHWGWVKGKGRKG